MLEAVGLRLYYGEGGKTVRAVDDVSFRVGDGETLGLVGESGCGKTSTGLALMRLLPPNTVELGGRVYLDGVEILSLDEKVFAAEVRWRKISMVFQGAMNSFNPVLRVGLQVAEPLVVKAGYSRDEALRVVRKLFRDVGLPEEAADRYPHELSGGMRQRAMIAMALTLSPRLLILDEPTSALDISIQTQIMNLLKRLKREHGLSMLFITHDLALVCDIADAIAVMYAGEIVESGGADEVVKKPAHPYTQLLIKSIPRLRGPKTLDYIPGAPPSLSDPPPGCRFHPRCPHIVRGKCDIEKPPGIATDGGRKAACWLLAKQT
jgi:peptide/nickel transport system ATP-binding protein